MIIKFRYNSSLASFIVLQFIVLSLILLPRLNPSSQVIAASFTNASDTLSNSRFSFKGSLNANVPASQTFATINSSVSLPDHDTGNLFPGDVICFNGSAGNGCIDNITHTVTNVPNQASGVDFGYTPANTATMNAADYVVSTQSAVHTISFKPATSVASGGKIIVTLPANSTAPTNGIPDADGFDTRGTTNGFPATLAVISGANGQYSVTGFTVSSVTLSTSGVLHTFTFTLSSALTAGTTYTITLGNSASAGQQYMLINPVPAGSSHVRGASDSYTVGLSTTNAGNTITYDSTNLKIDPVDGVLVSATVEQTLTFAITGENSATTCGVASGSRVTTSATTVPFGSIISSTQFYNGAQKLTVVTNSPSGYHVTVQENGVLTSDTSTIPNTACDAGGCSSGTQAEWNTGTITSTNQGLGFSLANATGTDASFLYNDSSRSFSAQPFSTTPYQLMAKGSSTASSSIYVCYRLGVLATQAAGFYYNKLTYIATPLF
jgi:hypothetical protein